MTILTFDHLISEELFNSIKTEFLSGDEKYRSLRLTGADLNIDLNENKITTFKEKVIAISKVKSKTFDFELQEEVETENNVYDIQVEEVTINFINDFMTSKIMELADAYKKSFVREVQRRNLYSDSQIANYSKMALKKLSIIKKDILDVQHLDQSLKDLAINSIDKVCEFISNEFYHTHMNIPDKIPFNLNRNQVVGLFHLLYENEYISSEMDRNDLFRLVEEICSYYDSTENAYKSIIKANKLRRSMFGLNPDKSSKTTIDELEKIFNKDFFTV